MTLIVIALFFSVALGAPSHCPKKCPSVTTQHFTARGCKPVVEEGCPCPSRWDCPTPEQYGRSETTCIYKDKKYLIGETVPVENVCRRGCLCRKSYKTGGLAEIECATVKCNEWEGRNAVGCRYLYSNDQCCSVGTECNELIPPPTDGNVTIRKPDCEAEGVQYLFGQRMRFQEHPCTTCVCSEEYQGPTAKPSCTFAPDCGLDTVYKPYLDQDCTPLYVNGTCCPEFFICGASEGSIFIYDETLKANGTESASTHCSLGTMAAKKGQSLEMFDCHHVCTCLTPPYFTCTRYATCADAVYARKNHESF